jgi:hypothetical protein
MDETRFIDAGNEVLGKDAVQDALAGRIAAEVAGIDSRIDATRARSLTGAFLEGLPDSTTAETALSTTQELLVRLIREESLDTEDATIVFDLSPVVRQVLADSGLSAVPLPPNTGRVSLVRSEDLTATLRTARFLDDAAPFVVAAPAVVLLVALLIAPGRSLLLIFAGVAIAAVAGGRILLLESAVGDRLIGAALLQADARAAAVATYEVVASSLIEQELFIILIGAVLAGIGVAGAIASRVR